MIIDPKQLKAFDVIRLPYSYPNQQPELKRFVVLCQKQMGSDNFLICLKATSKVALYLNDQTLLAGVVYYSAGVLSFFEENTAIQPDNLHPISHRDITVAILRQRFECLGTMPSDFPTRMRAAVQSSKTMKPDRKKNILAYL